jgi:hypothetical protein
MDHPSKTVFRVRWPDTLAMIGLCIAAVAIGALMFLGGS